MLQLTLDPRQVRSTYVLLGLGNLVLIGTFAMILSGLLVRGIFPIGGLDPTLQFDMRQSDQVVFATWHNAMLNVLVAMVAVINFWIDRARIAGAGRGGGLLRVGWLILAACGLFVSMDETIELHETVAVWLVGSGLEVEGLTDVNPIYLWVLVLGPVILAVGVVLAAFFARWLAAVPVARWLALGGIACWLGVPLLEFVESRLEGSFGAQATNLSRFAEESLEIWGASLLLLAAGEYLIGRSQPIPEVGAAVPLRGWRWAVPFGALSPLLLLPAALVAALVNPTVREMVAETGYTYSAWRIEQVIESEDTDGHYLLLSEGCSQDKLTSDSESTDTGASLLDLERLPLSEERLTIFTVPVDAPEGAAHESLHDLAQSGSNIWHLACARPSQGDEVVEDWLHENAARVETLRVPGAPPVLLTRALT